MSLLPSAKFSILGAPFRALRKLKALMELFDYTVDIDGSVMLRVNGDVHVLTNGEFRITTAKDLVLLSGKDPNPDRPGYIHSVWENPTLDELGRPLMMIPVSHFETGEMKIIVARFTDSGKLRLPAGWLAPLEYYPEAERSKLPVNK